MKKIAAYLLIVLMLAASVKDVLMWASFKVNQDFIAKTLCVNQDKPEIMCSGKCYLAQKIAEGVEHSGKGAAAVPSPDELRQVVYYQALEQIEVIGFTPSFQKIVFARTTFTGQSCLSTIFQPPRAQQVS